MTRVVRVGAVVVGLVCGLTTTGGAQPAAAASWHMGGSLMAMAGVPAGHRSPLAAVACPSSTLCIAVGDTPNASNSAAQTFAEAWNGSTWSGMTTPDVDTARDEHLNAIACPSTTECLAAGDALVSVAGSVVIEGLVEDWNGTAWSIAHTSSSVGRYTSISCPTTTWCEAVGAVPGGAPQTAAEVWDGTGWSGQPMPTPSGSTTGLTLNGVSCPVTVRCFANGLATISGSSQPLVEEWSGGTWSVLPNSSIAGSGFAAVTCTTVSECVGVGYSGNHVLVATWDGIRWTSVSAPDAGTDDWLLGVTCFSAAVCLAVGTNWAGTVGDPVAEQWDGSTWSVIKAPSSATSGYDDELAGAACWDATDCIGVGQDAASTPGGLALGELFGPLPPSVTTVTSSANPATFGQSVTYTATVAPTSPVPTGTVAFTDGGQSIAGCGAVPVDGSGQAQCSTTPSPTGAHSVVASYSGDLNYNPSISTTYDQNVTCGSGQWCIDPFPSTRPYVPATSVACTTAGDCYATRGTLDEWHAGAWTDISTPANAGLGAVACAGSAICVTVGATPSSPTPFIAASVAGGAWATMAQPVSSGELTSVNCAAATACVAVGQYQLPSGYAMPLAETWNGRGWTSEDPPAPGSAWSATLRSVSCPSPSLCIAVGTAEIGTGGVPLTEEWDGTAWSIIASPTSSVASVSCATTSECVAVSGAYVARWDGSAWSDIARAAPAGAVSTGFNAVDCPGPNDCVGVGVTQQQFNQPSQALVERWDGTTWTVESVAPIGSADSDDLRSVDCSSTTSCVAVGEDDSTTTDGMMSEHYFLGGNGTATVGLASNTNPIAAGQMVTFTATVSAGGATPTGTVTFTDSTVPLPSCEGVPLDGSGVAHCTASFASAYRSPHSIAALYSGDASYAATSASVSQAVTGGPTAQPVSINASANPATVGEPLTYTATLTAASPQPTQTVSFFDGAALIPGCDNLLLDSSDQATCSPTAYVTSAGSPHSITATYWGDATYAESTSPSLSEGVDTWTPQFSMGVGINPVGAGEQEWIHSSETTVDQIAPTGTVTFDDAGTPIAGCSNVSVASDGSAQCYATFATLGSHTLTAVSSGDAAYTGLSSSPVTLSVIQGYPTTTAWSPPPSTTAPGIEAVAAVYVRASDNGTPTGTVGVSDSHCTSGTVSGGWAEFGCTWPVAGTYPVTATYSGDATYTASSTTTQTVTVTGATVTTLTIPTTSAPGFNFSGTATVRSYAGAIPTGTIAMSDSRCAATPLDASGHSQVTCGWDADGTFAVTATYSGDANFTPSTSSPTSVVVSTAGATTVSVTVPGVPLQGRATTATVQVSVGSVVENHCTVTLTDGSQTLGSVAISVGSGSTTITLTHAGQRTVSASGCNGVVASTSVYVMPAAAASSWVGVRGSDGQLYYAHGGAGFVPAGGEILAAPAIVTVPQLDGSAQPLFIAIGTDHRPYVRSLSIGWVPLSTSNAQCNDAPGAAVSGYAGSGTLFVFCQGTDHAVWEARASLPLSGLPQVTTGWMSLGGVTYFGPAATVDAAGHTAVFVTGTDGHLWESLGSGWTGFAASVCTGHPAAATTPGGATYLGCHGSDGALWVTQTLGTSAAGPWGGFVSGGGVLLDGPGLAATSGGLVAWVEGTGGSIWTGVFRQGYVQVAGSTAHGAAASA